MGDAMREALHALFSEALESIWAGILYGISISVGLIVVFVTLRYVTIFHKAAQLWGGQ